MRRGRRRSPRPTPHPRTYRDRRARRDLKRRCSGSWSSRLTHENCERTSCWPRSVLCSRWTELPPCHPTQDWGHRHWTYRQSVCESRYCWSWICLFLIAGGHIRANTSAAAWLGPAVSSAGGLEYSGFLRQFHQAHLRSVRGLTHPNEHVNLSNSRWFRYSSCSWSSPFEPAWGDRSFRCSAVDRDGHNGWSVLFRDRR